MTLHLRVSPHPYHLAQASPGSGIQNTSPDTQIQVQTPKIQVQTLKIQVQTYKIQAQTPQIDILGCIWPHMAIYSHIYSYRLPYIAIYGHIWPHIGIYIYIYLIYIQVYIYIYIWPLTTLIHKVGYIRKGTLLPGEACGIDLCEQTENWIPAAAKHDPEEGGHGPCRV